MLYNNLFRVFCFFIVLFTANAFKLSMTAHPFKRLAKEVSAALVSASMLATFTPVYVQPAVAATSMYLAADSALPAIGSPAPSFTLPSNAGKDISLSDLKGKRTVLYFYPGDFTQGCTIEAQA